MAWQVKDEVTEINNIQEQIAKIRDSLFINSNVSNLPSSFITGGTSGKGSPIGAGGLSGLQAFPVDDQVTITDVDTSGTPTGVFDKINLTTSNMVVRTGVSSDIKFIQGTLNNGQYIILKPIFGSAFTLKTGGNIAISSDVIVSGDEFCILIFYEDVTSPDANGNYTVHKALGGGGSAGYDLIQDEGSSLTQRSTIDFVGVGVTAQDIGGKTRVTIPGASGSQTPWLGNQNAVGFFLFNIPRIEYNLAGTAHVFTDGSGTQHGLPTGDFFEWKIGVGLDQFAIGELEISMNVPLDMNLNFIKFQAIPIPPPPAGLEKRFLFCDATDLDKLKARTPTGIVEFVFFV